MMQNKYFGLLMLIILNMIITLVFYLFDMQLIESYVVVSSIMILVIQLILNNAFYTYWAKLPVINFAGALILPLFLAISTGELEMGVIVYLLGSFFLYGVNSIIIEKLF